MYQNDFNHLERHHHSLMTVKNNKPIVQAKIIQSSNFSKNIKDLRASTNIKFYQKSSKKTHSNYFKQKMESIKPIVCLEIEDQQFSMQPQQFQRKVVNQDNNHHACIGLMNPMYINVKNNGAKRLTMTKDLNRQKQAANDTKKWSISQSQSVGPSSANTSPQKKTNVYNKIVSQMNDYFTLMKLSAFKNNKMHMLSKRSAKSKVQKRKNNASNNSRMKTMEEDQQQQTEQLNVVGLKPLNPKSMMIMSNSSKGESPMKYQRYQSAVLQQKQTKRQNFNYIQSLHNLQPKLGVAVQVGSQMVPINYQKNGSKFLQTKSITIYTSNIDSSCLYKSRQMRPFTQQIMRKPTIKKNGVNDFCFGMVDSNKQSVEELQRLKIMYYKDLIWKSQFSLGIKYINCEKDDLKFYVGKGNNSKLIKTMMAKRWWWSLQSKQQNANFLWTQLKVYSIYEKQESLSKASQSQQELFMSKRLQQQQSTEVQGQNKETFKWHDQYVKICDKSSKILTKQKYQIWKRYLNDVSNAARQKKCSQQNINLIRKRIFNIKGVKSSKKITNHLEQSRTIGNKKALYKVMMLYFKIIKRVENDQIFIPLTYHITAGLQDDQYLKFLSEYYRRSKADNKTCWIVKPGQLTNRGKGIKYCRNLNQIKPIIKKKQNHNNGTLKTFLIQQYIDKPLLYKERKFDIRHYIMLSSTQGVLRGYFYQQGYIRTTSYKYRLDDNSSCIHLTNDAVQKYCKDYGKYQKGNKLSYEELAQYLQSKTETSNSQKKDQGKTGSSKIVVPNIFKDIIFPQIRQIAIDVIFASSYFVDPNKRKNNFQIFGLDLMIDQNYKCFLIQVNTNPCLQLSSPLLSKLIPEMVDNALALTIDCQYPPPQNISSYQKRYNYPTSFQNKFELVLDSRTDGQNIKNLYQAEGVKPTIEGVGDDDQNYQSGEQDNYQY